MAEPSSKLPLQIRLPADLLSLAYPHQARNPYATTPPDFQHLAALDHDNFGKFVQKGKNGRFHIDFGDPRVTKALNEALLLHDFGIKVNQPKDRLCPPVPNRLNYLLWLQDLLGETRDIDGTPMVNIACKHDRMASPSSCPVGPETPLKRQRVETESPSLPRIRALDIGTGATAIYPILGCALDPLWVFDATDIDPTSLENAQVILEDPLNNDLAPLPATADRRSSREPLRLRQRIKLLLRTPEDPLIPAPSSDSTVPTEVGLHYHCTMSNPPFYSSAEDLNSSAANKELPPQAACTGMDGEMITPGGEVAFVTRQIEESLVLRERILWYTSMLGKASSIPLLLQTLRERKIDNIAVTTFRQGKTWRWAVAWSFLQSRVPNSAGMATGESDSATLIPSTIIVRSISSTMFNSLEEARQRMLSLLNSLSDAYVKTMQDVQGNHDHGKIYARFPYNSWNRAARRAKRAPSLDTNDELTSMHQAPVLCVLLSLTLSDMVARKKDEKEKEVSSPSSDTFQLKIRWTYGRSRVDFESFATMLARSLSRRI